MTLPQYRELAAYWQKSPPIHLLLAALMQYKGNGGRTNDLGDLVAEFGKRGNFGPR